MDVEHLLSQNQDHVQLLTTKLKAFKKDELKECVRKRNLPVAGNKIDLIKRLVQCLGNGVADAIPSPYDEEPEIAKNSHVSEEKLLPTKRRTKSEDDRQQSKLERESIVLWKKPLTTIHYGAMELVLTLLEWCLRLLRRKWSLLGVFFLVALALAVRHVEGPHQENVEMLEKYLLWCLWWVGLGVLSSVGLGTGLHTFLLYLGPHIAAVTLAAYECGNTDFPSPPYPESILCPDEGPEKKIYSAITVWHIMAKVRVEAFCWGVGTALGELPPYFMARAHRLSGYDPEEDDNEEEQEFFTLQEKRQHPERLNFLDRTKLKIERLVEKVGFFGILACASIPNPLFDLAGITCGHFLVPFWTFFGATVIGKAVIKMHIQKLFVILAFNETLIEIVVSHLHFLPIVGHKLEQPFRDALRMQKEKLHRSEDAADVGRASVLGWIFEKLVLVMVVYFLLSILNSLAQTYHKRLHKKDPIKKK